MHEISNNMVCATSNGSDQTAHTQSDQSLCSSLEYSMSVKLLTEHLLEVLSLKGGCTGSSESTLVKIPHSWKSHVMALIALSRYPNSVLPRWAILVHLDLNNRHRQKGILIQLSRCRLSDRLAELWYTCKLFCFWNSCFTRKMPVFGS